MPKRVSAADAAKEDKVSELVAATVGKKQEKPQADPEARKAWGIYVKPRLMKELKQAALDEDKSLADVIETAFNEYLRRHGHRG